MEFEEILRIEDDLQRNDALYSVFNEDERLASQAGQVEFLTTFRELEKYVTDQSKILDIGAGTGVYSFPLAKIAKEVVALEPASRNYQRLTEKIVTSQLTNLAAQQKSSLELEEFPSGYFDIVLLFGPLYHLSQVADREESLRQAKRLLAPGGKLFIAFINHDMIPMTETARNPHYLTAQDSGFQADKGRVRNRPFVFFTLKECREMLEQVGLSILSILATDGFAEMLAPQINAMDQRTYQTYLDWHFAHCKDSHLLGASNHFLFICQKDEFTKE